MKKTRIKSILVFFVGVGLLLIWVPHVLPYQIVIGSDDQFEFARTLMERGEFGRAVAEFERFIHFFPDDPQVPKARYLTGMCHLKDRRPEAAREVFSQIIESEPSGLIAGKALFLIGESYYQEGLYKESEHYFVRVIEKFPILDLKNAAFYRLGWSKMQANRWRDASENFRKVGEGSPFYDSSQELAKQSLKGETLPYKSPALSGALAAIVPGLGHLYVSRYKDAAIAFLLNGLFIWAAAESFHEDQEVLGGILTFFELGWYSGNIYSALNVTHKHNLRMQNDFRRSLKDRLDLHLFTFRSSHVGVALNFRF